LPGYPKVLFVDRQIWSNIDEFDVILSNLALNWSNLVLKCLFRPQDQYIWSKMVKFKLNLPNITDMAKLRPTGRMRPAKHFLRPLKRTLRSPFCKKIP